MAEFGVSWTNEDASHMLGSPAELDMQVPSAGTNQATALETERRWIVTVPAWEVLMGEDRFLHTW
jgi:hypothetical protein